MLGQRSRAETDQRQDGNQGQEPRPEPVLQGCPPRAVLPGSRARYRCGNATLLGEPMSRALFVNIPAHGHVNPTLPLVGELVARGERVDYAITPDFEPAVRRAGAGLLPYDSTLPTALAPSIDRAAGFRLPARILEDTIHVLPQLLDAVGGDPPDYVVHDPFSLSARLLA